MPIITIPRIFDIAALLHHHNVGNFYHLLEKLMIYREQFLEFVSDNRSENGPVIKVLQNSVCFKDLIRSMPIRAKRRARLSIDNTVIIKTFFEFFSAKGHFDWHLIY